MAFNRDVRPALSWRPSTWCIGGKGKVVGGLAVSGWWVEDVALSGGRCSPNTDPFSAIKEALA